MNIHKIMNCSCFNIRQCRKQNTNHSVFLNINESESDSQPIIHFFLSIHINIEPMN